MARIRQQRHDPGLILTFEPMNLKISKFYFSSPSLLDVLPEKDLALFRNELKLKRVRKGKILFTEGSFPKGVYVIKRGKVKIFQETPNGNEQIVYIYTPGEMFGYRPLLCHDRHPASAMTMEECSLYFLASKQFEDTLKQSTLLSNLLLENLSHEFTVLVNRIAAFAQKSVKERTALSLLILSEKYRKDGGQNPEISLSRKDLASFVGTTHETIARIITQFKNDKIIKILGRKIIIIKSESLYRLAEL